MPEPLNHPAPELDRLLSEQLSYYRARAPEYTQTAFAELDHEELASAKRKLKEVTDGFKAHGDVLELACGPGTWTAQLLEHADTLTAVDGSPEMLALAAREVGDGARRVRFMQADLFNWQPDRRYDAVFFGFWLSHVPLQRFAEFWSLVADCLKPRGRVLFIDDAYRTAEELIEGERSTVIRRHLQDGTPFRAFKVPHTPEELERRLDELGWRFEVKRTGGPFFWGVGARR